MNIEHEIISCVLILSYDDDGWKTLKIRFHFSSTLSSSTSTDFILPHQFQVFFLISNVSLNTLSCWHCISRQVMWYWLTFPRKAEQKFLYTFFLPLPKFWPSLFRYWTKFFMPRIMTVSMLCRIVPISFDVWNIPAIIFHIIEHFSQWIEKFHQLSAHMCITYITIEEWWRICRWKIDWFFPPQWRNPKFHYKIWQHFFHENFTSTRSP